MTRSSLILIATAGSVGLLAGAYLFQALGWAPCKMCLWQRWPHAAAILIGGGALFLGWRSAPLIIAGALAALTTAGIGLYHSGVERKWWEGPASCSGNGSGLSGLEGSSLLPGATEAVSVPQCDAFEPFLFGLTMANWNALFSAALVLLWLSALRRT